MKFDNVKIGDKFNYHSSRDIVSEVTVVKVTQTTFTAETPRGVKHCFLKGDGRERGNGPYTFSRVTEFNQDEIDRSNREVQKMKFINFIGNQNLSNLPYEKLREIVKTIKEGDDEHNKKLL